jgi:predicted dehydrogenase
MMTYGNIAENRPKIAMHDAVYGNGGPMVDLICHFLDLMRWYYGSNPKSVSAQWRRNTDDLERLASIETKAPDNGIMTVEYECGNIGILLANWGMPTKMGGYGLQYAVGSEGMIKAQNKPADGSEGIVISRVGEEVIVNINPEDEMDCRHDELAVYDHFIAEIEGRGKSQTSFEEGIYTLATSMAAIKSGTLKRPVTIAEILEQKPTIVDCMKA